VAAGSLACGRCDAPVALAGPAVLTDALTCPYCAHRAPVRDFLSLTDPTRPARVVVRVR
jgi:DNA-directed RNA polymerase subunit RPC12/RpoP